MLPQAPHRVIHPHEMFHLQFKYLGENIGRVYPSFSNPYNLKITTLDW